MSVDIGAPQESARRSEATAAREAGPVGTDGPVQAAMQTLLPAEAQLKYRLGEIHLFTVALRGMAPGREITDGSLPVEDYVRLAEAGGLRSQTLILKSFPASARIPRLSLRGRRLQYAPAHYQRYIVRMDGTFAEYLASLSSSTRSSWRRKVRKMQAAGAPLAWRRYSSPTELDTFFRLAGPLAERTYQARLLNGALPSDPGFRSRARELASKGEVRAFLLFLGDDPIAYLFCPVQSGVVRYDYVGYDADYAEWSPGSVLQYFALESLFEEKRFRIFDFTEGEGQHKRSLATDALDCVDLYLLPATPGSAVTVGSHLLLASLSRSIVWTLDRLGLKQAVKRYLRRSASATASHAPETGTVRAPADRGVDRQGGDTPC